MLTAYDEAAITYDAIGNPTKWRDISSMTWEGRELQSATVTAGPRVTYEYNSSGIRTKKTLGSAIEYKYTLDGTKILSETATQLLSGSSYTLYYLYDASGSVQGFIYNNQYYYFQKNLQGDVIRILNSNGAVVTEYTYDAWGNVLTTTGSLASTVGRYNPFRYRSYYYDAETGFYYLQSRYYDPTVGRFLNADGIVGANGGIIGNNLFSYCNNNPVNLCDPSGYEAVIFPAPKCDEEILDLIEEAGLDAPTYQYQGSHQEGKYVVHTFAAKPIHRINRFLFWTWRSSTFVIAKYYFIKIDKQEYADIYSRLRKLYPMINWTKKTLFDFANCGPLGDPRLDKVQACVSAFAPSFFNNIEEKIERYNTQDSYELYQVHVNTYNEDMELIEHKILKP